MRQSHVWVFKSGRLEFQSWHSTWCPYDLGQSLSNYPIWAQFPTKEWGMWWTPLGVVEGMQWNNMCRTVPDTQESTQKLVVVYHLSTLFSSSAGALSQPCLLSPNQGETAEAWGMYPGPRWSAFVALGSPGASGTSCAGHQELQQVSFQISSWGLVSVFDSPLAWGRHTSCLPWSAFDMEAMRGWFGMLRDFLLCLQGRP